MKVLIIDDEPHIRQMMRFTLEASGYRVEEAEDGEAGLAHVRGATDFLRKPMTPEALRAALAAAIAGGTSPHVQRRPAAAPSPTPEIELLTLNGFKIRRPDPPDRSVILRTSLSSDAFFPMPRNSP